MKQSNWIKKASWRQKNEWWLRYWKRIQVKYYILKRRLKNS